MQSEVIPGLVILAVGAGLYFLPAVIAAARGHHQAGAIFVLDLLLGWTLLGWIVAIVWSFTATGSGVPPAVYDETGTLPSGSAESEVPWAYPLFEPSGADAASAGTKTCPDCAEAVKAAARVCRFCGYEFTAAAP